MGRIYIHGPTKYSIFGAVCPDSRGTYMAASVREQENFLFFCDNQSMVAMINTTSLSCKNCMVLIRIIVLHCLIHNV